MFKNIPKIPLITSLLLGLLSLIILYSAAGGCFHPWCFKQALRFLLGFGLMLLICHIPLDVFYKWAYALYFFSLFLLIGVETSGLIGMGAKRWLNFYIFNLQPSEIMRVAIILALARYFSDERYFINNLRTIITASVIVLVPVILIIRQPDLGTALLILGTSVMLGFLSGIHWWKFIIAFLSTCLCIPVIWSFLHTYQKNRILIFLNPNLDPKGSGYHILQSKIALGSGGLLGKGYLNGTQTHLYFLPEKQTDFIFTMFGEEFGLVGSCLLIGIYILMIGYGYHTAMLLHKNSFACLCVAGFTSALFLYVFVNTTMVMGLLPVVGVPLPFLSYGGTSLISLLISQGIICSGAKRLKKRIF